MKNGTVQSLNITCPKCGAGNLRMMAAIVFDPVTPDRSMVTTCTEGLAESVILWRKQLVEPSSGWGLIARMICPGPDGCGEKSVLELGHSQRNGAVLGWRK